MSTNKNDAAVLLLDLLTNELVAEYARADTKEGNPETLRAALERALLAEAAYKCKYLEEAGFPPAHIHDLMGLDLAAIKRVVAGRRLLS